MARVNDVAAAIIERTGQIDTFKLQKLAYYSQAWHLVWRGEPLFSEQIEAWAAGPVVRALYDHHRGSYSVSSWVWGDADRLKKRERRTVNAVVDSYGKLSGRKLSHLTHNERPWQTAREGLGPTDRSSRAIDLDAMAAFYSALDTASETVPIADLAGDDD